MDDFSPPCEPMFGSIENSNLDQYPDPSPKGEAMTPRYPLFVWGSSPMRIAPILMVKSIGIPTSKGWTLIQDD